MIEVLLREYNDVREQEKFIKKRKEELSKEIKEYVTKNGSKDSKGSYYSENDKFVYGSQAKKSIKINEDKAKSYFESRGLINEVMSTIEIVDEEKIEHLIAQGILSPEDIENIVDIKVSYSLDVKVKEDIVEVETATRENSLKPKNQGKMTLKKLKKIIKQKY